MLLKLSKLTGDDFDRRRYINTSMIAAVGSVAGDPDSTLILMIDRSKRSSKYSRSTIESWLYKCLL